MSADRYELKGKIGQGGVGAVYRAFDKNLNREVAIKRVLPGGGYENDEEATKAMLHEATSLCSIQHPHIVTVFDAGVDSDGPYVVMELLSGRTLDEMVERGTLTFPDFREIALQSQEALIAAQDLDLIHRDIKPTNMMVTWLPSGRFQVKLVDFGLAKFSPQPSLQTIDHGDSVFGSIYFMAPEQFERTPLDQRTDMYSLGCVYYYCLTGQHPFDGETAPMVMTAHLQNRVIPLNELRPDLPRWLCDWVMWHIARDMNDRPPSARESLKQFLLAETEGEVGDQVSVLPPGTNGTTPDIPLDPSTGAPVTGHTAPQPILPPEGQQPSVHTAAQKVRAARGLTGLVTAQPASAQISPTLVTGTPVITPTQVSAAAPANQKIETAPPPEVVIPSTNQQGLSNTMKAVIGAGIATILCICIVVLISSMEEAKKTNRINEITAPFAHLEDQPEEIKMSGDDIQLILNHLSEHKILEKGQRGTLFQVLSIGTTTDGTDLDEMVATYAQKHIMSEEVRQKLFKVLELRGDSSAIQPLIAYVSNASNVKSAKSAIRAMKQSISSENFNEILGIATTSSESDIKSDAVNLLIHIAQQATNKTRFARPASNAFKHEDDPYVKQALLRLLGAIGGAANIEIIKKNIESNHTQMKIAAISAIQNLSDGEMYAYLLEYTEQETDQALRRQGFDTLIKILTNPENNFNKVEKKRHWTNLTSISNSEREQVAIISAAGKQKEKWVLDILTIISEQSGINDRVINRSKKAKKNLQNHLKGK